MSCVRHRNNNNRIHLPHKRLGILRTAQLTEGVVAQDGVRVIPHGALVLDVERVHGAAEGPCLGERSGRERRGRVVGQCRVDWRGLVDRRPVRRDDAGERRVW